jgi:hypothetical protein
VQICPNPRHPRSNGSTIPFYVPLNHDFVALFLKKNSNQHNFSRKVSF